MSLPASELQDLEQALSDRLYIQINGWHLYLGDAKLARPLAIECSARIDESAALAARKALEAVVDKTILGDLDDYSDVILIHTGGASVLPVYQKAIAG